MPGRTPSVALIGVPTRYGTAYPGSERTPDWLRRSGAFCRLRQGAAALPEPITVIDAGDIALPAVPWTGAGFPLRALECVLQVAERQAALVAAQLQAGRAPLCLGGDCTTLLGTALGLRRAGKRCGLVCLDAHGDFNTDQTTPSGNLHGMTVAALTGRGASPLLELFDGQAAVPAERIALLAVRDLDPPEALALGQAGVAVFSPAALRAGGPEAAGRQALAIAAGDGAPDGLLLHLDLDALDPTVAPGVGLPVPGGLTLDELLAALAPLLASGRLIAAELTEAAPPLDPAGPTAALTEELLLRLVAGLSGTSPPDPLPGAGRGNADGRTGAKSQTFPEGSGQT